MLVFQVLGDFAVVVWQMFLIWLYVYNLYARF